MNTSSIDSARNDQPTGEMTSDEQLEACARRMQNEISEFSPTRPIRPAAPTVDRKPRIMRRGSAQAYCDSPMVGWRPLRS